MRVMTKDGSVTLVRTAAGRLRALVGRAGDACCCEGLGAYKARECCDGEPTIWIDAATVERCGGPGGTVRVISRGPGLDVEGISGRCFTVLNETASVEEIRRLGLTVWGGDAIDCVSGCVDERCPPCPDACCIYATLPACEPDALPSSRRCCVLGSAYEMVYEERYTERVDRPPGDVVGVVDGDCPGVTCAWDHDVVTDTREEVFTAVVVHAAPSPDGGYCAGVTPHGRRTRVRSERIHFVDRQERYDCDRLRSIGGRYRVSNSTTEDEEFAFQLGEMPSFLAVYDNDGQPASMCGGHYERAYCLIAYPEPCPNPANPNQAINRRVIIDVRGTVDCDGGEQTVIEEEWLYPCGREELDPNVAPVVHTRREWRRTWTVRILSHEGCERLTCPEGRPAPGPGLLREPSRSGAGSVRGCGGCGGGGGKQQSSKQQSSK